MNGSSGSGGLALRDLPAETCLLLARTGPQRGTLCLGTWPFLSEWRISSDGDLQEKGPDHDLTSRTKLRHQKCLPTTHKSLSHLTKKRALMRASGSSGFLRHEPPFPCGVLNTPFSVPDSDVLVLVGLSVCWALLLCFNNKITSQTGQNDMCGQEDLKIKI